MLFSKRKHRISSSLLGNPEEESWDCTVCTFKNSAEAFRCEMCQTRKGTSTRKPKLNPQIVEEQTLIARAIIKERQEESGEPHRRRYQRHSGNGASSSSSVRNSSLHRPTQIVSLIFSRFPRNAVDRTCPQQFEVFANGFSVVITEYLPKNSSAATTPSGICKLAPSLPDSPAISNPSSVVGSSSIGNGTTKVENSYEATPYIDVSSSALAEFPAVVPKREGQEEGTKNQEGVDEYDIPPSPSVEASSPLDSLSSSVASVPRPRKRRKRRLQSSQGGNKIVRSLRSAASSISPGAPSCTLHASRVARVSLYRGSKNNTPSPRAYKRRKVMAAATPAEDEAVAVLENPPPSSPQEKSPEAQVEGVEPEPNSTSQNTVELPAASS
ncbi:unnamed protein product [Hymenolepis diminuta]|uniref:RanBP2-type domain-containing protein n=1 Tax=Hymenolepis diminuta TaxID=6216 RepID=A0A3P6Y600_HYMDI|nr:unnamed protein product [Hymenolepis diminuta]